MNFAKRWKEHRAREKERWGEFEPGLAWYGYVHAENGSLHVKRYFGPDDLDELHESPFVAQCFGPWDVPSREAAMEMLKKELGMEE